MTASQNVLFVGESPPDNEYAHPPGAGIARMVERSLRLLEYNPEPMDNWRDCGWSIGLSLDDARFEIALAATTQANLWMLQVACTNEPGMIARMFGKRSVDHTDDVFKIASVVHGILQSNGYTDLRWCLDGYPDDGESTSKPLRPHTRAK